MVKNKRRPEQPKTAQPKQPAAPADKSVRAVILEWAKSLAAGFVLFLVIRALLVQTFVITSGSMEGTLLIGDLLVLNKVAYGAQLPGTTTRLPGYTLPKVGDIVVFRGHHEPIDLIKRIVGSAGDTLAMQNKVLYRNGVKQTEPYVRHSDTEGAGDKNDPRMIWQRDMLASDSARTNYIPTRDNWGPIVVPPGHMFMMGDNRDESLDSRFWGPLSEQRIKGKAAVIYFSYDRESLDFLAWIRHVRWSRIGDRIR